MTRLTLNGTTLYAEGTLPSPGQEAPRFVLTCEQLSDVSLDHYPQPCKVLNIVPSLALPSFETATRRLAEALRPHPGVLLLSVSQDLPFAMPRLPGGPSHTVQLSNFRSPKFARSYGVDIVSGPLKGLMAPAVLVLDARHRVLHVELMREMSLEPAHGPLLAAVRVALGRAQATSVAAAPVATVAL